MTGIARPFTSTYVIGGNNHAILCSGCWAVSGWPTAFSALTIASSRPASCPVSHLCFQCPHLAPELTSFVGAGPRYRCSWKISLFRPKRIPGYIHLRGCDGACIRDGRVNQSVYHLSMTTTGFPCNGFVPAVGIHDVIKPAVNARRYGVRQNY